MLNKTIVEKQEARLRQAMLTHDFAELDVLFDDKLQFITHFGIMISKEDDLNGQQENPIVMHDIDVISLTISLLGDVAVAVSDVNVTVTIQGAKQTDHLRYMRVWRQSGDDVRLVAGSAVVVAGQIGTLTNGGKHENSSNL